MAEPARPLSLAEQDEEGAEDSERMRAYQAYGGGEGDSSDEDELAAAPNPDKENNKEEEEEEVEDEAADAGVYAQLADDDDDFGEFVGGGGADVYAMDDETLFSRVLANMDLRDAPVGGGGGGFDDDPGLFPAAFPAPAPSEAPPANSLPPLDPSQRAKILEAMKKMKPLARREGADALADRLLAVFSSGQAP